MNKPKEENSELVLVKEQHADRMRRTAESTLPRYLQMQFGVEGETVTLRLERNTDIDTNIAFTFAGDKGRKVYIPDRQVRKIQQEYPFYYTCRYTVTPGAGTRLVI